MKFKLPRQINKLTINNPAGELGILTHASQHTFQPTQTTRFASLTMQRPSLDPYGSGSLHPIFSQNLPEGFNRHYIAERLARHAKVNDMYLLALQGADGIGMLEYLSDFNLPKATSTSLDDILNHQGKEALFPQLLEKYYLRNTLSGMQPKVSIPSDTRTLEQKDLIVKTCDAEFPLLTVNEFVCMSAAKQCGLAPPKIYLSNNLETFVIERFDKTIDGTRLGYEDFTTLMKKGNSPDAKYTGSYETLLKATQIYTRNDMEVEKIYRYIVFNCLIGNGDAHLKNFALQYSPDMNNIYVAPPFDITHTIIYETIGDKMALKMGGSKVFPSKGDLINLAEKSAFYKIRDADKIITKMAETILNYLDISEEVRLFEGLKHSIQKSVSTVMTTPYTSNPIANFRHDKKRKFD